MPTALSRCVALVVVTLAVAGPAAARIAVTVTTPDQNVLHREVAAGLVEALQAERAFLHPPLATDDVALCRGDLPCLHRLGLSKGATHLLVIGVAGVDVRGALVTFTMLGPDGAPLIDDSAMLPGTASPRLDGASLAPRLLALPGLPSPSPIVERAPLPAPRPLSTPGAALVGLGALVVGAGAISGVALAGDVGGREAALPLVIASGVVGIASAAVGAALVVVDVL